MGCMAVSRTGAALPICTVPAGTSSQPAMPQTRSGCTTNCACSCAFRTWNRRGRRRGPAVGRIGLLAKRFHLFGKV
eukprot:524549-Pelagomonas_calceolata.AAC.4